MSESEQRPIVIRRKKVVEGGHHGGAWKVAYADFVTAMMAFFLLMWLLNATTEDQRKGLADYFSPSIPVHRTSGGGSGPFGGTSSSSEKVVAQDGTGAEDSHPVQQHQSVGESGVDATEEKRDPLEGIAEALLAQAGESEIADRLLEHVRLRRSDEGLVIELYELPASPLFDGETAQPLPRLVELIGVVGSVAVGVTNSIAVDNHVNTAAIGRPAAPGWDLTAQRALAARRLLADQGIAPKRFARVAGEADRAPGFPDPRDPRNRRTEIILLTTEP